LLSRAAAAKPKLSHRITPKIGQPQTHFSKHKDPQTGQLSLLFVVEYPEIADTVVPRYRFMSAFEQKIEQPDRNWQYILFAAEPYQTIAFKVPNKEIERSVADENGRSLFWTHWDKERKLFYLNITFKKFRDESSSGAPPAEADDMEM
jgi:splicing factor 3A subunit 2